jgi:hypothetical protein
MSMRAVALKEAFVELGFAYILPTSEKNFPAASAVSPGSAFCEELLVLCGGGSSTVKVCVTSSRRELSKRR